MNNHQCCIVQKKDLVHCGTLLESPQPVVVGFTKIWCKRNSHWPFVECWPIYKSIWSKNRHLDCDPKLWWKLKSWIINPVLLKQHWSTELISCQYCTYCWCPILINSQQPEKKGKSWPKSSELNSRLSSYRYLSIP